MDLRQSATYLVAAAVVLGAGVMAWSNSAQTAGKTPLIPYDGTVAENGKPVSGDYDFEFSIYPDKQTQQAVWTEEHTKVPVVDGRFSVVLGEGKTVSGSLDDVWELDAMYVGMRLCEHQQNSSCQYVDLSGRQRILAVPHAVNATSGAGAVGKIMSMSAHVDAPDSRFWLPCDGRKIPADSRLGQQLKKAGKPLKTPVLNDKRFLMGGKFDGKQARGGHNDGHSHDFNLQTGDPFSGSALGDHRHDYRQRSGSREAEYGNDSRVPEGARTRQSSPPKGGDSAVRHKHPVQGSIGSGPKGDQAGANLPQYHKVNYFIKIN